MAVLGEFDLVGRIFANMSSSSDVKKISCNEKQNKEVSVNNTDNSVPKPKEKELENSAQTTTNKIQDGGAKASTSSNRPKTSTSGSSSRTSTNRPSTSRTSTSRTSTSRISTSTASDSTAELFTKTMSMFNELTSTISNLSVKMDDIDNHQSQLENSHKRKNPDSVDLLVDNSKKQSDTRHL